MCIMEGHQIRLAEEYNCKYVAFPSISTGVYHFPLEKASKIAIKNILEYCNGRDIIDLVEMVCFDDKTKEYYVRALEEYNK